MNTWEIAILKSIKQLGGKAGYPEIFKELPKFIELTEKHRRITKWGGRPAFQHQVRSHITNLCQSGDLNRVARGRYSLTLSGITRIVP